MKCADCMSFDRWETDEWGHCSRTLSDFGEAEDPTSLAVAQDGESYKAGLEVHETFGCVQFQHKTSSEGEGTSKLG